MSTATATPLKIHVTRILRASRERVFAALTKPELMKQWKGPTGWKAIEVVSDTRPGGSYRIVMQGTVPAATPDGQPEERTGPVEGTYLEVVPNELLRYTWNAAWAPGEETIVTLRLSDVEGGTLLELTHEGFASTESAGMHEKGWTDSIGKLSKFVCE